MDCTVANKKERGKIKGIKVKWVKQIQQGQKECARDKCLHIPVRGK
jgi:hypothetical protein